MSDWKMTDEWQMVVDGYLLVEQHYAPKHHKYKELTKHLIAFLGHLHAAGRLRDGEEYFLVEVNKLAGFINSDHPDAPSIYESVVECAINLLREGKSRIAELEEQINNLKRTIRFDAEAVKLQRSASPSLRGRLRATQNGRGI